MGKGKLKALFLTPLLFILAMTEAHGFTPPADILEAIELCDQTDLHPVEGLWLCPQDETVLLIIRHSTQPGLYAAYVVESSDCNLSPALEIGTLAISPDPNKFKIKFFTKRKNGVFSLPCEGAATYSPAHETMTIEKPSIKISFQPYRLLPYMWRAARVTVKNPAEKVPEGMLKIYPTYDNNPNSLRRNPRYL